MYFLPGLGFMSLFKKLAVFSKLLLLTLFLVTTTTGCLEPQKPPLRVSSSPWPGYEPLYLARDLGYIESDYASMFELPSSDITMEAFRNHSTDLATLTLDETMDLLQDGKKLRILLVLDISNGGDAVLAKPDIKSIQDMKGKRVSIVNIPLGLYMLTRTLDHAGLERKDVEVFPMSETKQEDFYLSNNADVVITFEPVKTKLIQAGAHVIFDSSNIPNEVFDLLVVHEDVYQERRDDVCKVVNGWFKALDYMQSDTDDAAIKITKRLGLEKKDYSALMSGLILPDREKNKRILSGETPELIKPAERLVKIMLEEGLLKKQVDASNSIDVNFSSCY